MDLFSATILDKISHLASVSEEMFKEESIWDLLWGDDDFFVSCHLHLGPNTNPWCDHLTIFPPESDPPSFGC